MEWTVPADTAGSVPINIRFSNGTTVNRPMDISVNGQVVANAVSFPGTGSWDTWQSKSVTASLRAGMNAVRASATTANGGPNVDWLSFEQETRTAADWSRALADSTMARFPNPPSLAGWGYQPGFFLSSLWQVFQRTGDMRYFNYIKAWVDANVDSNGNITGLGVPTPEIAGKRLQLLREVAPTVARIAVLSDPSQPADLRGTEAAAQALGVQLQVWKVRSGGELDHGGDEGGWDAVS